MVFFHLRQRTDSIQGLLLVSESKVSKQMVKWAAGLALESIVLVEGVVQKPQEEIKSTTVSDAEVLIYKVWNIYHFPVILVHFYLDSCRIRSQR
jgi:aspartyl/asparaginyl-tRNA synthetase